MSAVVVGAGLMGRWHADAVARANGRVAAVVDCNLARAESIAARYPNSMAKSHLAEVLAQGAPSVVHLCTPPGSHERLACEAMEAGCHVLVEKPLAATLSSTERLFDVAAAHHVLLCPVHQFLFQPGILKIIGLLPRFGPIRHIDLTICSAGGDGRSDAFRDQLAFDTLAHPLSVLARLLGSNFVKIDWHLARGLPGELRLSGVAHGVSAGIVVSMRGRPTLNQLRIVAERGSVRADLFHGFATFERGAASRLNKVVRPLSTSSVTFAAAIWNLARRLGETEYAYPGLRELVRRFHTAVTDGGVNPISPGDTLAVAAARDRLIAAGQCFDKDVVVTAPVGNRSLESLHPGPPPATVG